MIRRTLREIWPYLALTVAVAVFPLVARNHYVQSVGAMIGLYSIIALGLCLVMGYAGQVSLGHAAFYGLGAYTSGILTTKAHLNPWLALVAGVVLTCIVAMIIGRPALRLHGHYLAMATLGFGIIVQIVFSEARELTGGFGGLPAIPPLQIGQFVIQGDLRNFYLIWLVAILALAVSTNVVNSRVGRALRAIHDSEIAAAACGIDVARYKLRVFVFSAALASIAGSLYAHFMSFISPDPFGLAFSIQLLVMVIVGGSRSVWGALLGAALMTTVGQQIEKTEAIKDFNTVVYGAALILFVIFMPGGLADILRRAGSRLHRARPEAASAEAILEVENVTKSFGGVTALDGVSFEVRAGEILAIIGPNGAGKTTLFNLISRVFPVTSGAIRILGKPCARMSAHGVGCAGVARTFQNLQVFGQMTVLENVMVGRHIQGRAEMLAAALRPGWARREEAAIRQRAGAILETVGLAERADETAANLTVGQQRSLELARALAMEPRLILLDEPAAGLTTRETTTLSALVVRLRDELKLTVALIEHDMSLVMGISDRVVVLDHGQKIADATPSEVQQDPRVIAAYLGEET